MLRHKTQFRETFGGALLLSLGKLLPAKNEGSCCATGNKLGHCCGAVLYANTYHNHYIFVVSKRSLVVSVLDTLAHKTTAYKFALQHAYNVKGETETQRKIKVFSLRGHKSTIYTGLVSQ